MRNLAINSVVLFTLIILSTSTFAQKQGGPNSKRQGEKKDRIEMMISTLDLNDAQSDQVKKLQMQIVTKTKPIKNELREKEARLITISTISEPNKKDVENIVKEISNLKGEIFMIKSMNRLEVRSLLNKEQKIKFDQLATKKGRQQGCKS